MHEFVHNMTMREKAYFKRFAQMYSGKKNKNYMQLYNELEKMTVFEKQKFNTRFANQPIGRQMSSELNYLFGQLLKSMINFHLENSNKKKLQKSILYIDILMEKGYRKQALKILNKAKKLAKEHEDFTTILKLALLGINFFNSTIL